MAKAVIVCGRTPAVHDALVRRMAAVARRVAPDGLATAPTHVIGAGPVAGLVVNPRDPGDLRPGGVALGWAPGDVAWEQVGTPPPDGSYALFRWSADRVEAVTDIAGSRSVWYVVDEDVFVASTSQRLLAGVLAGVELDERALPWMVVAGFLGPEVAWDRRARLLEGDAVLRLDVASWRWSVDARPAELRPRPGSHGEHRRDLADALRSSFDRWDLDPARWVLPLSGGADSRGVLCLLPRRDGLRTVTWGEQAALRRPGSDAVVAAELAARVGVENRFLEIDPGPDGFAVVLDRFVAAGEGRIDAIGGYTDGFALWRRLGDGGGQGIIRGDQPFGSGATTTEADVRRRLGLPRWDDLADLPPAADLGLEPPRLPQGLERRPGEPILDWRDRLHHQVRIPVVLSALNDIKLPYLEVVNPLFARDVVEVARRLPAELRTDKAVFRSVVRDMSPDVPYARRAAIADTSDLLTRPSVVEVLRAELPAAADVSVVPPALVDHLLSHLRTAAPSGSRRRSLVGALAHRTPPVVRNLLRNTAMPPRLPPNAMAFRTVLAARAVRLLEEDARAGQVASSTPGPHP